MGIFDPFEDLIPAPWFRTGIDDPAVCFPNLCPEFHIFFRGIIRTKVTAPPVRKSLQPGTFGGHEPAHAVVGGYIDQRGIFVVCSYQRVCQILFCFREEICKVLLHVTEENNLV